MDSKAATFYRRVIKEEKKGRAEGAGGQLPPAATVRGVDAHTPARNSSGCVGGEKRVTDLQLVQIH